VVVCTRDRPDALARCLDSLRAVDDASSDVVVVDNAPSSEATARLVAELAAHWTGVRYVREDRPGLDWARNRGLAEARGSVVAYTDDDVRVDSDWLRAMRRAFDDPQVSLVTGLVLPAELATDAQVIFEDWYGGMGKGMRPATWRGPDLSPIQRIGTHHLGLGANMAVRRVWLEQLGGFDTALDVGTPSHGSGDLDLFHRTLLAGGTARYEPTALVWHYHRREMAALRRQLTDNGRAFGVYLLTRLRLEPPLTVVRYALGTWIWWMVLRVPRRFLRREKMPLPLQVPEWLGLLQAPFAWLATRRYDRRIRASHPPASPTPRQTD
jgi:glycosyltransferase involved in cell wall biosynthesis